MGRGRLLLSGGVAAVLVGILIWMLLRGNADSERAARTDAAREKETRPTAYTASAADTRRATVRAPVRANRRGPAATRPVSEAAAEAMHQHLVRLRESLAVQDAARRELAQAERELREKEDSEQLTQRVQELEAQAEALVKAARAARKAIRKWLVADSRRPLEMYERLKDADAREGLGRRPGWMLASFYDNRDLEGQVLHDLYEAPDEHVRGLALHVVAARPSPARVSAVTHAAQEDKSEAVRVQALSVLTGYKDDPLAIERRRQIHAVFVKAAQDKDSAQTRIQGLAALSTDPRSDGLVALFESAAKDPDHKVRAVANQALRRWGAAQTPGGSHARKNEE